MNNRNFFGFILRNVADEWFLLDLNHPELSYKKPLRMNETGAYIYAKLEEGLQLAEIASILSAETGKSAEEIYKDAAEFIALLRAYGVPVSE